jgi:hypothetical protein
MKVRYCNVRDGRFRPLATRAYWANLPDAANEDFLRSLMPVFVGPNIRALEIPMRDALPARGRRARRRSGRPCLIEPLRECALDVFHYQLIRYDIMSRADMPVVQRSHGAGFTFEALEISRGKF